MAIRRCPYCKAIIDEQDKYCNNCGTQLLFPEDEFVEEEIPGDKILDKDEPEETATEDPGEERELAAGLEEEEEPAAEDDDEDENEDKNEDDDEAEDEDDEEDDNGDEDDLGDAGTDRDLKTEEKDEREDGDEPAGEPDDDADDDDHEDDDDEAEDDLEDEDESEDLDLAGAAEAGEPHLEDTRSSAEFEEEPDEEAAAEDVDTLVGEGDRGLEAGRGREVEAAEDDDDLNGLAEVGRAEDAPDEADKKYEVSIEDDELVIKTKAIPDTASLPPWANRIRETPPTVGSEEATRGTSPLSREWTTDSGIGIPERVTQAALPFSDTGTKEIRPPAQETDHVEEETREATAEVEEAGPAGGLSLKLRAKFVDWVFVTALWVISLWFTAQVVGVSFFRLLFGSPLQVLAFYLILLVLYFFLFLYFLGETLGDHYFSE